jgi:NADH dehydrogenase subunit N (EC 1.6.5.3)
MEYLASLKMALPEDILALGALALMLVAAWGGQRSTRAISWCSVAVLLGAGLSLFAVPQGVAFDGLLLVDAFSTYAKVLIYIAAAIAIVMAPDFFQRTSGDDLRPNIRC